MLAKVDKKISVESLGFEGWTIQDVVLLVLKICQPTSRVVGVKPGSFYDSQTLQAYEKVQGAFAKVAMGRVLFAESLDGGVVCKSFNRISPSASVENPPAQYCAECPFSKWEGGKPPACKETLNTVFLLLDGNMVYPYLFSVHGVNYQKLKAFFSMFVVRNIPVWSKVVELVLEEEIGQKGRYYVVKPVIIEDANTELQELAQHYFQITKAEVIEQSFEKDREQDGVLEDFDF